jgi:hypothetical protein
MIVLGLLTLAGAALALLRHSELFPLAWLFWIVAGPAGLAATAWWYRRLRRRDGVGTGERDIIVLAVLGGCAAVGGAFFHLGATITAIAFLAVALTRRSPALVTASVVFGVVVGLEESFASLSNGLLNTYPNLPARHLIEEYGTTGILTALGLILLLAGFLALRRERFP